MHEASSFPLPGYKRVDFLQPLSFSPPRAPLLLHEFLLDHHSQKPISAQVPPLCDVPQLSHGIPVPFPLQIFDAALPRPIPRFSLVFFPPFVVFSSSPPSGLIRRSTGLGRDDPSRFFPSMIWRGPQKFFPLEFHSASINDIEQLPPNLEHYPFD